MDTITQVTLGAAVGEAVLGKQAGYKAPLWGAAFGVLPDLDVLANPFLTEVGQIIAHRGITHSIFFCVAAAPLFGWLLSRIRGHREPGWIAWSRLVFATLATHVFIDLCTGYGTQIFQPFSNYPASLNSIFIVDPFYTLPLFSGITAALFIRHNPGLRRKVNYLGLGISTVYLLFGLLAKLHVNTVFEQNYERTLPKVERYITTPAPLSSFLWIGYAEAGDRVYAGLYSLFDDDRTIRFTEVPKRSELIAPYRDDLAVERLLWFSRGYFSVRKEQGTLMFTDLRFGRSDFWMSRDEAPYVWNYRLEFNADSTRVTGFHHLDPDFSSENGAFNRLINRILGEE